MRFVMVVTTLTTTLPQAEIVLFYTVRYAEQKKSADI
jgi:hypothetical protein